MEGGFLGGSTDEEDAHILDCGEENVLLGSAKAMDLVQEQHRPRRRRASEDLYPFWASSTASLMSLTVAMKVERATNLKDEGR